MRKVQVQNITNNHDNKRVPLNSAQRSEKETNPIYPYIGANNIMGYVDDYLFDDKILCIAEDGGSWGYQETCAKIYNEKVWVNNHAHVLTAKDNLILEYLMYYLNYADLTLHINGATRGKLTKSSLNSIEVPLPPLDQQKKIAAILDTADAYRQKTKALIEKYDELTQSLFLDMFGDPVINPKGWGKNILKNHLIDVKNGITRRPKTEEDKSGQIVLKLKHIRSNFINYDCDNRILLEESEKTKYQVNVGDLLFIRVNGNPNYVGRSALHDNDKYEVFFNDHIMRVRVNPKSYNSLFLCHYLNYPFGKREIFKRVKTSAGQHTINQNGLEKSYLIFPPLDLQNLFAKKVKVIQEQKEIAQTSLAQAESLFNSLLQRAFKGELTKANTYE